MTVIVTQTTSVPTQVVGTTEVNASSAAASSSSSAAAALGNTNGSKSSSGGLSSGGVTAIAVVVPIVIVALLVVLGLFLYRRRKSKKTAQEARRKEVEEYGYNPNDDPTLPAVGVAGGDEMAEDSSNGYRGWGNTSVNNRKASSTVPSGFSGTTAPGSEPAPPVPTSPAGNGLSEKSTAPLIDTPIASSNLGYGLAGAGGAVGLGAAAASRDHNEHPAELEGSGVQRGPSNASSSYSMAGRTDDSNDHQGDYGYDRDYSQYTPHYGGADMSQQPVVRDVNARRNAPTRVEGNGGGWGQQGNSSISQNF